MADLDFSNETYIVEGVVELDPLTGYGTIRTSDANGRPINFDPQGALQHFKGQEVRLVLVPLATIAQIQELARTAQNNGDAVEFVDDPSEQN
jgi:hypothetical protein